MDQGGGKRRSGIGFRQKAKPSAAWISTSLQASEVFSATHTGGRSRATHARSQPNTLGRRHILAAKPQALRNSGAPMELRRQEPAPRRLAVLYKPGLHRPAVPCTPVGMPALRTHRQVPPNQRPVLRSRSPESYKPGPMRSPLKVPKQLLRERELYSSPISLVLVLHGRVAPVHLTRTAQVGSRCTTGSWIIAIG
jgi:hypothetical protein